MGKSSAGSGLGGRQEVLATFEDGGGQRGRNGGSQGVKDVLKEEGHVLQGLEPQGQDLSFSWERDGKPRR